jgi:hypothetical protein
MNTFKNTAAQGDILIQKIKGLPEGVSEVAPEGGCVIVTHSETGHHHVMDKASVKMYRLPEEIYECFLVVEETTALEHKRSFDTHAPIQFEPGIYRVRRQREYTPEGFRRVED